MKRPVLIGRSIAIKRLYAQPESISSFKCAKSTETTHNEWCFGKNILRNILGEAITKDVGSVEGGNQGGMIDSGDLSVVVHILTFVRKFASLRRI